MGNIDPTAVTSTDCCLSCCPLMARLACSAAEICDAPEVCDAIKSDEMYAFPRLPPALLRINGIFDCNAASGWTVKATILDEPVAARALALTGNPPATNSLCAGDEILVPSQSRLVEDGVRSERGRIVADQTAVRKVETRPGGHLDESEVEAIDERIEK